MIHYFRNNFASPSKDEYAYISNSTLEKFLNMCPEDQYNNILRRLSGRKNTKNSPDVNQQ